MMAPDRGARTAPNDPPRLDSLHGRHLCNVYSKGATVTGIRKIAATIVVAASSLSATAGISQAEELEYPPPDLFIGVKAGDTIDSVVAQQGWYQCSSSLSLEALCFDGAALLGEVGTLTVEFLDGRAYSAQLLVAGAGAIYSMLGKAQEANGGRVTLTSFTTTNTSIDAIKAVHDLGPAEATNRFSRYLTGEGPQTLTGASLVPRDPPDAGRYPDEKSYLDSLPPGGVVFRLMSLGSPLDATVFTISLPPRDRKHLFPEYCVGVDCEGWSIPPPGQDGNWWQSILRWFGAA